MSLVGPNEFERHITPVVRRLGFAMSPNTYSLQQDVTDEDVSVLHMSANCGTVAAGRVVYVQYKLAEALPEGGEAGVWFFTLEAQDATNVQPTAVVDQARILHQGGPFTPVGMLAFASPGIGELVLTLRTRLDVGRRGRLVISEPEALRSYLFVFDVGG